MRVAKAPQIDPRGAKLHLECGLESQVAPKRHQVALGVRLGRPKSAQVEPKRRARGSKLSLRGDREAPS